MVLRYARTGTRSWSIGGEQVLLKPFRGRRASEPEKSPAPVIAPPSPPKPVLVKKTYRKQTIDVYFTFVIGGYKDEVL